MIKELASKMVLVDYNPKTAEGGAWIFCTRVALSIPWIYAARIIRHQDSDIVIVTASVPMNDIDQDSTITRGNVSELLKASSLKSPKQSPNAIISQSPIHSIS